MPRITFRQPAEPGDRFAADAFDESIGKEVRFSVPGLTADTAVLVAADVDDDGQAVNLTIEWEAS